MTAVVPTIVRTELTVGGMHCGNCVRHVQEALGEIDGVTAEVRHPAEVTVQQLLDAIDEAGYEVAVREAPAHENAAGEAGAR